MRLDFKKCIDQSDHSLKKKTQKEPEILVWKMKRNLWIKFMKLLIFSSKLMDVKLICPSFKILKKVLIIEKLKIQEQIKTLLSLLNLIRGTYKWIVGKFHWKTQSTRFFMIFFTGWQNLLTESFQDIKRTTNPEQIWEFSATHLCLWPHYSLSFCFLR